MKLGKSKPARQAVEQKVITGSVLVSQEPAVEGRARLGELLVQQKVVTHGQLAEALLQQSESGNRIGTLLVDLGVIDEKQLAQTLSEQAGLALVDLRSETPDPKAVALLSESVARSLGAVPVRISDDDVVVIAVSDPSAEIKAGLQAAVKGELVLVVGTASSPAVFSVRSRCTGTLSGHA